MRTVGTTSRGVRCPVIREGDDLVQIVTDAILACGEEQGIRFDYVDGEFNTEPHARPEKGKFVVIGKEVKDDFWKSLLVTE